MIEHKYFRTYIWSIITYYLKIINTTANFFFTKKKNTNVKNDIKKKNYVHFNIVLQVGFT